MDTQRIADIKIVSSPQPDEGRIAFVKDLADLINKHSLEQYSDTPDHIIASYLDSCLQTWNLSVMMREDWYGRKIGNGMEILNKDRHLLLEPNGGHDIDLVSDGDIFFKIPCNGESISVRGQLHAITNNPLPSAPVEDEMSADEKMGNGWTAEDFNDRRKPELSPDQRKMDKLPKAAWHPGVGTLWKNKFTQHTVKVTGSTEFRDVPLVLCRDIFSEVPETLSVELNDWNKIFQQAVNHG